MPRLSLSLSLALVAAMAALHTAASVPPSVVVSSDGRVSRQSKHSPGLSLAATASSSSADSWSLWSSFETGDCSSGGPIMVIVEIKECSTSSTDGCSDVSSSGSSSGEPDPVKGMQMQCTTDPTAAIDALYGDQPYFRVDYFNDSACSEFVVANVFVADGACHAMRYTSGDTGKDGILSKVATVWSNGTASVAWFYDVSDCSGAATTLQSFTETQLASGKCVADEFGASSIGFSSAVAVGAGGSSGSNSGNRSSGLSIGAIVGLVVSCIAFFT